MIHFIKTAYSFSSSNIAVVIVLYFITIVFFFLYSFTQVDLSLTLSRVSIWQDVQKFFQYIGYFNRPLSTTLYFVIVSILFGFYFMFLSLAKKNKLSSSLVWKIIIGVTFILAFSYNAFSYDLFNYIFDAKIVTMYQQSPYEHKALDFPSDPMLSFMHWTHRTYPYGPVWLGLTVPLSIVGLQFFLPTFFLFKALMGVSFIGTVYFIQKIIRILQPKHELFGMIFFALNPLVLIESLVSAHNDIVMIFFAMWALYILLKKQYFFAFLLLFLSIGIKFATVFLIPVFIWKVLTDKKGKAFDTDKLIIIALSCMIIALIGASMRTIYQAWYFLYLIPFAALVARKYYIFIPSIIISFFSLLQYAPFLFLGNWDPPVLSILISLTIAAILLSLVSTLVYKSYMRVKE